MKTITLLFILLVTKVNYAQDSLKNNSNYFHVTIGLSENVPFTEKFNEVDGNENGASYSSFQSTNYITMGYFATVGYGIGLNDKLTLVTDLSYYSFQEKKQQIGQSTCHACEIPVADFNGINTINKKYTNVGGSLSLSLKLKKVLIDNGIGLTYLLKEQTTFNSFNFNNNSNRTSDLRNKDFNFNCFTSHKIGYELIKNKFNIYLGGYLNYNKYLTKSINPHISFQFKI
jgi:hypothetical protein